MRVGIRVDVNHKIATGHIVRTVAVAECLSEMGHEVIFICTDPYCMHYLKDRNIKLVLIDTSWDDYDSSIDKMLKIISEQNIESLLIDSYYVTAKFMKAMNECVKVTYFDDLYFKGYGCRQIINGSIESPEYDCNCQMVFAGPEYAPLRKEFSGLPQKIISDRLTKLLLTSGGTDNMHFCKAFLSEFLKRPEFKDISVCLAVGSLFIDRDILIDEFSDNPRVEIYVDTDKMCRLMRDADYAVSAGGTTLYELCAVGLPASTYVIADNQIELTRAFDNQRLLPYAGDIRESMQETLNNIFGQISDSMSCKVRGERSRLMQKAVDGMGTRRIAKILVS